MTATEIIILIAIGLIILAVAKHAGNLILTIIGILIIAVLLGVASTTDILNFGKEAINKTRETAGELKAENCPPADQIAAKQNNLRQQKAAVQARYDNLPDGEQKDVARQQLVNINKELTRLNLCKTGG